MELDITLRDSYPLTYKKYTIRDIIFQQIPHRSETSTVIYGHKNEELIEIRIDELRSLICQLKATIKGKKLVKGDTVMLASFYSSNELANAVLFTAFACLGIRVFIPIYPETEEFDNWHVQTDFKAVIIPYQEILHQKGHEREKEVITSFASLCRQKQIPFLDAYEDFEISSLLQHLKENKVDPSEFNVFTEDITMNTEAVIFTTSGTSGKSKLVVYDHGAFSRSCQSWQEAGLFTPDICGNTGFTPLFTHTIGIRHFINALWTGNAFCILTVDWFLNKPEEASYLLLLMNPGHIVGGPALFNMLNEFFRQFPKLKISLQKNLKTLISIGAPYNLATARQLKGILGLDLWNAFGTTETQMVLLNKPAKDGSFDPVSLGKPLPGVIIGLKNNSNEGSYELCIQAPYQSSRIINESPNGTFFSTGDIVSYEEAKSRLSFKVRKGTDFIKDEFGVKIPITILKKYYSPLYLISTHIEWFLLDKKPGLAALIFLSPSFNYSSKEIREQLKSINERLKSTIEPFEFAHRCLERFSIINSEPPLTRKGTVCRKTLQFRFQELIGQMCNPFVSQKKIESVEIGRKSLLYTFSNPHMATLLEALKINVRFDKGSMDYLYYQNNGIEEKVLDLVGGFGSGLLGHDHPFIKKAIRDFLDSGQPPVNSQGSLYYYPSLLARELNKLFGKNTGKFFKVQFGNTGSEAMEIAMHHAYFEWWTWIEKRRDEQLQLFGSQDEVDVSAIWEQNMKKAAAAPIAIIVINNCFHGYSSGARSLLNNKKQRHYFSGLLNPVPLHVIDTNENWKQQIENYLLNQFVVLNKIFKENGRYVVKQEKFSNIIASVIEPVRGEGGIYKTKIEVADFLAQQKFPLISDEIQCGLGRTGSLPSYPKASYYLLGKSLGGGYEKISAVLIDDNHFKIRFPQYYTSTFANGEMAACAGLAVLETISKENVTGVALNKGSEFIEKLNQVAVKYPDIIQSVAGLGLMLGVHFNKEIGKRNILLRSICDNELMGYLIAGWFFHNKKIRVLPSLSKPDSIRLEPSVYISEENMNLFCDALDDLCHYFRTGNMYGLLKYLMNDDPYLDRTEKKLKGNFPVEMEEPAKGALKVGFIGNFTRPAQEFALIEPDLKKASDTGLRILFNKMQTLLEGKSIRLFSKNLMNGKIHFTFYILPYDTAHLELIARWGKKRNYIGKIQETINRLSLEGVSHISLGAHTSILSGNGLYLAESKKVKILTGNTLTVASCLYHMDQYLKAYQLKCSSQVTIVITGAGGNIGSGLAGCLDEDKYVNSNIILVGNNLKKLELVRKKTFPSNRSVTCSTDLFSLQEADIIISCTNTNDPLIFTHHIDPCHKVFIIDIAIPGSVSEEVKQMSNVQFCMDASTVYVPHEPELLISTHTPAGKVFCCAAEVMLAALYDVQLPLKGHLDPESIKAMMRMAIKEGFFKKGKYAPSL